jgi:SNF2 family DNA or RNA helicase
MGQTRPVTSIRLIMEESVEIHIQKMQERKAQLAEMGLSKLSKAEIMAQRVSSLRSVLAISSSPVASYR